MTQERNIVDSLNVVEMFCGTCN